MWHAIAVLLVLLAAMSGLTVYFAANSYALYLQLHDRKDHDPDDPLYLTATSQE